MMARQRMMENFSRHAMAYDARAEFQHGETVRVVDAALMMLPEQARILDVGCGTGQFAAMAKPARPEWRVTGVDIAGGMCALAAAHCKAMQADVEALPLADASYDAVVSSLCLQWLNDLPRAMGEMARVLKPGGRMILTSLLQGTLYELEQVSCEAQLELGLLPMRSLEEYLQAVEMAGLRVTLKTATQEIRYYPSVRELMDSMRQIGAGNHFAQEPRGMTGARRWKTMLAHYESQRVAEGIPASWHKLFLVLSKP